MQQNVAKGWDIVTVLLLLFSVCLGGNSISFTVLSFLALSLDHKPFKTPFLWFKVFTVLNFHTESFPQKFCWTITKIAVFLDVVLWTVVRIYPSGGMYFRKVLLKCWIFYLTARHHISEGGSSRSRCCKNLISCVSLPGCSVSHFRQLQSREMSLSLHFF
jgi:hypothetical protein